MNFKEIYKSILKNSEYIKCAETLVLLLFKANGIKV